MRTIVGLKIEEVYARPGDIELAVIVDTKPDAAVSDAGNAPHPRNVLVGNVEGARVNRANGVEDPKKIGNKCCADRKFVNITAECVFARCNRAERTNIADEGELLLRMARLSSDRKGTRDIHNAQIAGVAIQYGQTRQNGRFLSRSIQQTDKAMVLQARNFGIVHLVVHSGVQIVSHFPVGVEDAHAEVELNMRDGAVDSDLAQGLRLDHGRVTSGSSTADVKHFGGNRKRGRCERVIAGCFLQRLWIDELLQVFRRSVFPGKTDIVALPES